MNKIWNLYINRRAVREAREWLAENNWSDEEFEDCWEEMQRINDLIRARQGRVS